MTKLKIKSVFAFFALLITFTFTSCKKTDRNIPEKNTWSYIPHRLTIGFSIDTLAIERWQRDIDIFINKVREMDADVIVQNAGNSVEEQKRQLEYLLERNVDAVVVLPKDATSISESIQKIRAKGIPVISYDRLALNSDINLYITIDSEKVGEYMATELLRRTTGTDWYCILGPEEDFNMTFIKEGLDRILRTTQVKINHTFYTDGWNYDLSYDEMVRILKEDKIPDAIICGNDAIAASVIQAITRYYPDIHIPICGQDADITACQYIVQGKQEFTIYKPIVRLAELAAESAVYLARQQPLDIPEDELKIRPINNGFGEIPAIWLEPAYVDKNNMDRIIIDSGFHNAASVYGERS